MAREMKATEVIVPCRISYAHIWKPNTNQDDTPGKYGTALLIPKDDKKTITKIENAIKAAIDAGKSKLANKQGKVVVNGLKLPLRDADEEEIADDAYKGMMFFNASSDRKPQVVNRRKERIEDEDEVYSGCFCNVSINFYAFNRDGNKGIAAGLGNIQKVKDGERLAGGHTADDDFDELDDEDEEDFL